MDRRPYRPAGGVRPAVGGHRSRRSGCPARTSVRRAAAGRRPAAGGALNLGGIANATVIDRFAHVLGYDLGPANALTDLAARRFFRDSV
nr:anhydro-N-acetylmuramic acid kinase [Fodinicola feengrottensis]